MAIIRKEAYYNSSTGVDNIRALIWRDDESEPIGLFQIAHGVSEHIGRYDDFARFLAGQGFVVFGNDHIGHGKSVIDPSQLGFTAERDGHFRFVDDMHILTRIMTKRHQELPLFLCGHSMGSFCARVYAGLFYDELSGLILCGTGQIPKTLDFTPLALKDLVDKFGAHATSSKISALTNKLAALLVPDKQSDLDWLSVSRKNIDDYMLDPLCGAPLTAAGMRDLISIAVLASDPSWAYALPQELPIMIISGAKDPIGFNGKSVLAVADALELTGHHPEVILYPNCRHEILNEDTDGRVYDDILEFLSRALRECEG